MTDFAVSTSGLTKCFKGNRVVDGLCLQVPKGSIYGFVGRNGAGKTTTVRMLMGLTRPTSGTSSIMGIEPSDRLQILRRTAYVSENKLLFEEMTGREMVRFNRSFFPTWSDKSALEYTRRLGVPMDRPFGKLSLGNKTKLCLLMALSQRAELLILDEPTLGLDPVAVDELSKILIEDSTSEGGTVLLCSHLLVETEKLADWIGIIDGGKLLLQAPLDEIRDGYRRIIASGRQLPTHRTADVISIVQSESSCEYILRRNADHFLAEIRNKGATILDFSPLNLNDVFLNVVKDGGVCITGNAIATHAPLS